MQADYVYTHTGWQRPVFLSANGESRFALDVMPGDSARVEVAYDPVETVKVGRGQWVPFDGGLGGTLPGATALRVNVERVCGWVTLCVK